MRVASGFRAAFLLCSANNFSGEHILLHATHNYRFCVKKVLEQRTHKQTSSGVSPARAINVQKNELFMGKVNKVIEVRENCCLRFLPRIQLYGHQAKYCWARIYGCREAVNGRRALRAQLGEIPVKAWSRETQNVNPKQKLSRKSCELWRTSMWPVKNRLEVEWIMMLMDLQRRSGCKID